MTWQEYALARQYLVEERIGTRLREAKAAEDAQARQSAKALRGNDPDGIRRHR